LSQFDTLLSLFSLCRNLKCNIFNFIWTLAMHWSGVVSIYHLYFFFLDKKLWKLKIIISVGISCASVSWVIFPSLLKNGMIRVSEEYFWDYDWVYSSLNWFFQILIVHHYLWSPQRQWMYFNVWQCEYYFFCQLVNVLWM